MRENGFEVVATPVIASSIPKLIHGPLSESQGLAVLSDCHEEVARRLAMPAWGAKIDGQRIVRLWNAVEISVGENGRDLSIHPLEPSGKSVPSMYADLAHPIGALSWTSAFIPLLAHSCQRLGFDSRLAITPAGSWLHRSLRIMFKSYVDFRALRRDVLEFLAPDPLVRSLANRVFWHPDAQEFNWVGRNVRGLALAAIEHPKLLPFISMLSSRRDPLNATDPVEALRILLKKHGIKDGAWKRLEQWGYEPFEELSYEIATMIYLLPFRDAVAHYANLLFQLDVKDPPPELFTRLVGAVATSEKRPHLASLLDPVPLWFMRALLHKAEVTPDDDAQDLHNDLHLCLYWLIDCRPKPDANQRKAGWEWILEQACEHAEQVEEMEHKVEWAVPLEETMLGGYRVVPIRNSVALRDEAKAMLNCLDQYREQCVAGTLAVFSIRDPNTGKRVACFAAERKHGGRSAWKLTQVVGKSNSDASSPLEKVAGAMVAKMNLQVAPDRPPRRLAS